MTLKELTEGLGAKKLRGEGIEIKHLTDDSREVKEKTAFVAVRGIRADGHDFIGEALARGACAIIAEREVDLPPEVGLALFENTRAILPRLAGRFYGFPEKGLTLIGITGTNGKTSVSFFVKELLSALGRPTGLIGTIHYDLLEEKIPATHTTPAPLKLRELLFRLKEAGGKFAVMEVSSHALDQGRVEGLPFEVAVFTNLSRDHLDYHGSLEDYFQAKMMLFERHLSPRGTAVINVADPWGRKLAASLSKPVIKVGEDVRGMVLERTWQGYVFRLRVGDEEHSLATTLYGDFQLENLLLACSCGLALGVPFYETVKALEGVKAPPGRLELVAEKEGALVFVDYAHTPEALRVSLLSLRPLARRLVVVFGCGGERDRGKRPLMGQVAEEVADLVVLTSDNPRGEDPERIIADILSGMKGRPVVVPERKEAIFEALSLLREGDILLVAGKGHETYQEIAGRRYPFSDQEVIREILAREAA